MDDKDTFVEYGGPQTHSEEEGPITAVSKSAFSPERHIEDVRAFVRSGASLLRTPRKYAKDRHGIPGKPVTITAHPDRYEPIQAAASHLGHAYELHQQVVESGQPLTENVQSLDVIVQLRSSLSALAYAEYLIQEHEGTEKELKVLCTDTEDAEEFLKNSETALPKTLPPVLQKEQDILVHIASLLRRARRRLEARKKRIIARIAQSSASESLQ